MNLKVPENEKGADYIIGDLHGCYTELFNKLHEVEFDIETDRLFSVGDLVDRGENSMACVNLISKPWFYCVLGNHESMVIDSYARGENQVNNHAYQYGSWFKDLDEGMKELAISLMMELPYSITIGDNRIGITHAEPPSYDWNDVEDPDYWARQKMIWGRDRIAGRETGLIIKNIKETYHGHTPLDKVKTIGNTHYIDTGSVYDNGYLTILRIN